MPVPAHLAPLTRLLRPPQPRGRLRTRLDLRADGGEPVNLATGEEEYRPAADLQVYNPTGPSVGWSRKYNSMSGVGVGLGAGWSTPYDFQMTTTYGMETRERAFLIFPNGAQIQFQAPVPTSYPFAPSQTNPVLDYASPPGVRIKVRATYVPGPNRARVHRDVRRPERLDDVARVQHGGRGAHEDRRPRRQLRLALVRHVRNAAVQVAHGDRGLGRHPSALDRARRLGEHGLGERPVRSKRLLHDRRAGNGPRQRADPDAGLAGRRDRNDEPAGAVPVRLREPGQRRDSSGYPYLGSISVPSPTGTGMATATVTYDPFLRVREEDHRRERQHPQLQRHGLERDLQRQPRDGQGQGRGGQPRPAAHGGLRLPGERDGRQERPGPDGGLEELRNRRRDLPPVLRDRRQRPLVERHLRPVRQPAHLDHPEGHGHHEHVRLRELRAGRADLDAAGVEDRDLFHVLPAGRADPHRQRPDSRGGGHRQRPDHHLCLRRGGEHHERSLAGKQQRREPHDDLRLHDRRKLLPAGKAGPAHHRDRHPRQGVAHPLRRAGQRGLGDRSARQHVGHRLQPRGPGDRRIRPRHRHQRGGPGDDGDHPPLPRRTHGQRGPLRRVGRRRAHRAVRPRPGGRDALADRQRGDGLGGLRRGLPDEDGKGRQQQPHHVRLRPQRADDLDHVPARRRRGLHVLRPGGQPAEPHRRQRAGDELHLRRHGRRAERGDVPRRDGEQRLHDVRRLRPRDGHE